MDTEQIVAGLVLLILGGLYAAKPSLLISFQVWTQKKIMGADYVPSGRTYKITRFIGAFLAALGLLVITGILE